LNFYIILQLDFNRHWKYIWSSSCNKIFNIRNFFKIQIGGKTCVNDLHFLSWTQTQKSSFFGGNFRFKVKSNNFSKYTKLAYFVICFFTNFSFIWRQTLTRLQTQLDILYNPVWWRSTRNKWMRKCFQSLYKSTHCHLEAMKWLWHCYRVKIWKRIHRRNI